MRYRGIDGGEGGIRTHGTVSRTLAFEASTFNHSVTSPQWSAPLVYQTGPARGYAYRICDLILVLGKPISDLAPGRKKGLQQRSRVTRKQAGVHFHGMVQLRVC